MSFSIYITYWDNNLLIQIQQMIQQGVIQQNTRIIVAFANFNFISGKYIPGISSITLNEIKNIVTLVHSVNATISISIGGPFYHLTDSDLYEYPIILAENINGVLQLYGFDGVDFDIEYKSSSISPDFAITISSIINILRTLNSELYISLTTPGLAALRQPDIEETYQSLLNMTIGSIDAWQPMEYDLWLEPISEYINQIQYDIKYYMTNWLIPSNKIMLGLMGGQDDMNHVLMLEDALNLTKFAKSERLKGIMMWDATIDGRGCAGNDPYAYSMGIQALL